MILEIPLSSRDTLSRQIYTALRDAILQGKMHSEERLPATRSLAEQLGVSRTVVLSAYDQLLAEGFIEGRHGSGTYVAAGLGKTATSEPIRSVPLQLSRFGRAAESAAPRVNHARKAVPFVRYDFSYARGAALEFPHEGWRRTLLRYARRAPAKAFDYAPSAGNMALRKAIAVHLQRSRAVACDPSQVIIVNGSQQALDLIARVLLERGERVVVEDPHYQGMREVFLAQGARLYPVAVDREGVDPKRLPRSARLLFVTPSHQFPTGAVLPLARRLSLLAWARSANAVIVEDDYDGEFRYESQSIESLQGLDRDGRVVYVGTFSRTIFPALRIGYLVVPKSLVSVFTAAKWLCDRHTSTLEQETLAQFIASGAYERYLRIARRKSNLRREALLEAIQRSFKGGMELTGERSGTHIVLWPGGAMTEEGYIARALARSVHVFGISPYFLRKTGKPGIILGYSRLTPQEIRAGIQQLAKAWMGIE